MDDANDEVPVFTQQQYNRLGLKETAGIGTSVIVVRATDPDTGEYACWLLISLILVLASCSGPKRKESLTVAFHFWSALLMLA